MTNSRLNLIMLFIISWSLTISSKSSPDTFIYVWNTFLYRPYESEDLAKKNQVVKSIFAVPTFGSKVSKPACKDGMDRNGNCVNAVEFGRDTLDMVNLNALLHLFGDEHYSDSDELGDTNELAKRDNIGERFHIDLPLGSNVTTDPLERTKNPENKIKSTKKDLSFIISLHNKLQPIEKQYSTKKIVSTITDNSVSRPTLSKTFTTLSLMKNGLNLPSSPKLSTLIPSTNIYSTTASPISSSTLGSIKSPITSLSKETISGLNVQNRQEFTSEAPTSSKIHPPKVDLVRTVLISTQTNTNVSEGHRKLSSTDEKVPPNNAKLMFPNESTSMVQTSDESSNTQEMEDQMESNSIPLSPRMRFRFRSRKRIISNSQRY